MAAKNEDVSHPAGIATIPFCRWKFFCLKFFCLKFVGREGKKMGGKKMKRSRWPRARRFPGPLFFCPEVVGGWTEKIAGQKNGESRIPVIPADDNFSAFNFFVLSSLAGKAEKWEAKNEAFLASTAGPEPVPAAFIFLSLHFSVSISGGV